VGADDERLPPVVGDQAALRGVAVDTAQRREPHADGRWRRQFTVLERREREPANARGVNPTRVPDLAKEGPQDAPAFGRRPTAAAPDVGLDKEGADNPRPRLRQTRVDLGRDPCSRVGSVS
jgi:hypothetical protein